jgi:hypothetical protein
MSDISKDVCQHLSFFWDYFTLVLCAETILNSSRYDKLWQPIHNVINSNIFFLGYPFGALSNVPCHPVRSKKVGDPWTKLKPASYPYGDHDEAVVCGHSFHSLSCEERSVP